MCHVTEIVRYRKRLADFRGLRVASVRRVVQSCRYRGGGIIAGPTTVSALPRLS